MSMLIKKQKELQFKTHIFLSFIFATFLWCTGWAQTFPSPGGVGETNLKLWNKANAGVTTNASNVITAWLDQANTHNYTVVGSPVLQSSALNYNPTVLFNGSSYFSSSNSISPITQAFAVGKINNSVGNGSGAMIGISNAAAGGHSYFFHTEGNQLYSAGGNTNSTYTTFQNGSNNVPYSIFEVNFANSPGTTDVMRINGNSKTNTLGQDPDPIGPNATNPPLPVIGARTAGSAGGTKTIDALSNGSEIAEAILFTAALSTANRQKVESYLAIKYGITLSNTGGGTNGDYLSSAGTTIWDASDGNGYHKNVIGIGRDRDSELTQKQSHTADDTTRIYLSSLAANNAANAGNFATNNSFIMVGNNGLAMKSTGSTEHPSGIDSRINREWKVTNTNFSSVTFSMNFKLNRASINNAGDLRLLVDADGDFLNATSYAGGSGSLSISASGSVVTVSGISTTQLPNNTTRYFTIASVSSSTPLSVTFSSIAAILKNNELKINWTTASEVNSDRFEIEASKNGTDFFKIGTIKTLAKEGSSSSSIQYHFTKPITGLLLTSMAIFLLSLGSLGLVKKRNELVLFFAACVVITTFYACSKQPPSAPLDNESMFVRIAQIDKDGTKTYSKAIKVVKN